MQREESKETVYLAGKITGDPLYREKFDKAARELEAAGFVVLNPATLPDGFTWEEYMHVAGAMLDVCKAACFLPDWTDSAGATMEFGRAAAKGTRIFMFAAWQAERQKKMPKYTITAEKTGKLAFRCLACEKTSVYPARTGDGRNCAHCGGHITPVGFARAVKPDAI